MLRFIYDASMAVIAVLALYFAIYPQPAQADAAPSWVIAIGVIAVIMLIVRLAPAIMTIIRGQPFVFFSDRTSLQRAHGSLSDRLKNVERASAIWVIGQKFYHDQENTHVIKKLLLPNPDNPAFKFQIDTGPNQSAGVLVRQITELAKKAGAEVRWYDHFISHSIVLADTDKRRGWVHIESVFPHSTTSQRPSYTIYRRSNRRAVLEMQRIFDEMWSQALKV